MKETHTVTDTTAYRIFISGPIEAAKQILREECLRDGLCVTVEPTTYIYTGGEETCYVVGLINYPRFPSTPEKLYERALRILHLLLDGTFQHSALLVGPSVNSWITKRTKA